MVRGLRVGTAPLENATLGVPVSLPVQESVVKGKGQRSSNSNFDFTGDSRLLMEADFA